MSDIPKPPENVQLEIYADDMNTLSSSNKYEIAEQSIQRYLNKIFEWTKENGKKVKVSCLRKSKVGSGR